MEAVRIETKVDAGGRLTVEGLPFREGEPVEVIVLLREAGRLADGASRYPLRGTQITYVEPDASVAVDDWSAGR